MALTKPSPSMLSSPKLASETATASTSGTAINFTSVIPNNARRVTVLLKGISFTGSENPRIQLGVAGSYTTAGYYSAYWNFANAGAIGVNFSSSTSGIQFSGTAAGGAAYANVYLELVDPATNLWQWTYQGYLDDTTDYVHGGSGYIALSGTLDSVRVNGLAGGTFDAGLINLSYE